MALVLVAPATAPAVAVAEAANHLRAVDDESGVLIATAAAAQWVENDIGRALLTSTWRLDLDKFPAGALPITLPRPPLQSVTSVQYYDAAGSLTTLSGTAYQVVPAPAATAGCASLIPAVATVWPETQTGRSNAVQVTYVAGYAAASDVPAAVKAAILLMAGELYERRQITSDKPLSVSTAIDALLCHYRASWV